MGNEMADVPNVLTPQQVAEILQVKASFIYEQSRKRAGIRNPDPLPVIKIGRYLRIRRGDLEAWIARQKPTAQLGA